MLVLASLTSGVNLIYILVQRVSVPVRQSYVLEVIALIATIPLTYVTHQRTRTSSSILLLFWPVYSVGLLIWARTLIATKTSGDVVPVLALRCAVIGLGLISFIFECFAPEEIDPLEHENPIYTANIFSRWTFGWMTPLMKKGASDYITENDLPDLRPSDQSAKLNDDLEKAIHKKYIILSFIIHDVLIITSSKRNGKVHLWKALFVAFGSPYAFAAFLKLVQDTLSFLQPQFLRWLLAYISDYQGALFGAQFGGSPGPDPLEGFAIAALMFVAAVTRSFILHQVRVITREHPFYV